MNFLCHIVKVTAGCPTLRRLNFTDFRETTLTEKSFAVGSSTDLELGRFYFVEFDRDQSFKVAAFTEVDETNSEVVRYLDIQSRLAKGTPTCADPIGTIRRDAELLKIRKGRTNPFFKSLPAVVTWLIEKNLTS